MRISGNPTTWLRATGPNQTVVGGSGNESFSDSEQLGVTLVGGTGDNTYTVGAAPGVGGVGSWSPTIIQQAATGTNTVIAYASYALPVNIQVGEVFGAGHTMIANSQGDLLIAENAKDTLVSGSGNDVLVGNTAGGDFFVFPASSGYDSVYNFIGAAGTGTTADTINLSGYGFTHISQVEAALTQQGSNVLLTLDSTDAILFESTTVSSLLYNDFVLNAPAQYTNFNGVAMPTGGQPTTWLGATATSQTVTGGTGNDQLSDGGFAGVTLAGGTGSNTYTIDATSTVIQQAATGTNTVNAYVTYVLPSNIEVANVYGAHTLTANGQGDLLFAVNSGGTLVSGAGNDVLVGSTSGGNTFSFPTNSGDDAVYNFIAGGSNHDSIDLTAYGFTNFSQLQTAMVQQGSNVLLTLDANDAILLENTTLSSIVPADFVINSGPQYANFFGAVMPISRLALNLFAAAAAGQTITGVAGTNQLSDGGLAGVTLVGGSGDNTYNLTAINSQGNATTTIVQAASGVNTVNVSGNYALTANIEVATVTGAYTLTANGQGDLLIAASAGATLVSGAGADVLVGSASGGDTFVFPFTSGDDAVYNFIGGTGSTHDTLNLTGYGYTSFSQVQASMVQQGSNVLLTLDANDAILLENTTLSSLVASDFVINSGPQYTNFAGALMPISRLPQNLLAASAAGQTVTGGTGNDQLSDGGLAGVVLAGGSGDNTYNLTATDSQGNATTQIVQPASGANTVNVSGNYALPWNIEVATVSGAHTLIANSQGDLLIAANAGATLVSGAGSDVLVGSTSGGDTLAFPTNSGDDAVYNFIGGSGTTHDTVDLNGYAFTSYAQVQAAMIQQGSNVLLTLDANDAILFENTTLANFVAADFLLNSSSLYYNFYGIPVKRSGNPNHWLSATAAGQTINGLAGNNQLGDGNYANVTLNGSSGDNTYSIGIEGAYPDLSTTVINQPAGGVNTLNSWASAVMPTNVTIGFVYGDHVLYGNNQGDLLFAESINSTVVAGSGNDVLVGTSGGLDDFVFNPSTGHDAVYGFIGSGSDHDMVELNGYGFNTFSQVQAAMTQQGTDVVLNLDANDAIVFRNTTISSFNASDFLLSVNQGVLGQLTPAFDDEFNTFVQTGPLAWTTRFSFGNPTNASSRSEPKNGELELYVDSSYTASMPVVINPFSDSNGILTITANPTPTADLTDLNNYQYVSGMITTAKSFSQLYGYFDIRAELPSGNGLWPTFWLLPANGEIPEEIDIMEQVGDNLVYQGTHNSAGVSTTNQQYFPNLTTGYHDFGLLWTAESLTWTYDGTAIYSMPTPLGLNTPMYMLLTFAIGGTWPGAPSSSSEFPAHFNIDYVHAYSIAQLNAAGIGAPIQTFTGTGSNDTFTVDNSADTVVEPVNTSTNTVDAAVNYTLPANVQNLTLMGNASLTGIGNNLNNVITANSGTDILNGMGGSNTLVGGTGPDTFVFNTLTNTGTDVVQNFIKGDTIDMTAFYSAGHTATLSNSGSNLLITFGAGFETIQVNGVSTSTVTLGATGLLTHN
jgi:Ca2+-binding RTX toxin-like protein